MGAPRDAALSPFTRASSMGSMLVFKLEVRCWHRMGVPRLTGRIVSERPSNARVACISAPPLQTDNDGSASGDSSAQLAAQLGLLREHLQALLQPASSFGQRVRGDAGSAAIAPPAGGTEGSHIPSMLETAAVDF